MISIVTTTFNSAATVRDTLECVKQQVYPNVEHIVVDGRSQDSTLEIVRKFPHVAKVISELDKGVYDAMNKGISVASGEVIGILNSDDVYLDQYVLSKVAKAFEDDQIQACYGDLQYVDLHDPRKVLRTWRSGRYSAKSFYWGWMPPHPTFFVRKEVYTKLGGFNTRLRSAADYELMLRLLLKNHISARYIPEVLVRMRAGGISNVSIGNRIKANKEDRMAWKINELRPYFFTLYMKPIRKIPQFLTR